MRRLPVIVGAAAVAVLAGGAAVAATIPDDSPHPASRPESTEVRHARDDEHPPGTDATSTTVDPGSTSTTVEDRDERPDDADRTTTTAANGPSTRRDDHDADADAARRGGVPGPRPGEDSVHHGPVPPIAPPSVSQAPVVRPPDHDDGAGHDQGDDHGAGDDAPGDDHGGRHDDPTTTRVTPTTTATTSSTIDDHGGRRGGGESGSGGADG